MSKLYSYTYMSLDGVIESPQQWSFTLLQRPRQSDDVPFATLNNTIKKLVVSDSLRSAEWQNTSTIGDADMEALKGEGDGDIHITGSGTLVRNWIQRGLVDDVILMVCPVLVGAGKRFFENGTTTTADIAPGERELASTTSEILDRRALEWSRLCMAGSIPDAA